MALCNINWVLSLYASMEGCLSSDAKLPLLYIIQIISEGGAINFLMLSPLCGTNCYSIKVILKHELINLCSTALLV